MRKLVAVLTLALSLAALAGTAPAHAAKACALKSIVGAPQSASKKAPAKAQARRDWKNRVAASRGPLWSSWNVANDKSVDCRNKGATVQCRARATPCKELGSMGKEPGGEKFRLVR